MRPLDTTPAAHAFQLGVYRRMTLDRRLELALEMSDAARRTALDGILARHPEYDEHTAVRALFRVMHGAALYARVWPGLPAPAP